jgi:hypothetical protein
MPFVVQKALTACKLLYVDVFDPSSNCVFRVLGFYVLRNFELRWPRQASFESEVKDVLLELKSGSSVVKFLW